MRSLLLILLTAAVSWWLSDIHSHALFRGWIWPAVFVLCLVALAVWFYRRTRPGDRGDADGWDLCDSCFFSCSGWHD
ncbi:hypothetical protein SAMN05216359_102426 [Roseateles sp. YR242]|uniref:hypothetical protein n=1 Tax=Roseateles sp. YR242 TaxID=1855305 RepID=UPI0008AE1796|nr:hypothetical protein [Roseateles sp. YR242]SEK62143.1 hypothetical protein SAMN05216359_102426 [Roseateles sp. YR242]